MQPHGLPASMPIATASLAKSALSLPRSKRSDALNLYGSREPMLNPAVK
jgi:hypothetical protein